MELLKDKLGLNQWPHFQDEDELQAIIRTSSELGARHLRIGISWADYERPGGPAWLDRQVNAIADAGFEVLWTFCFTPVMKAESAGCASGEKPNTGNPPKRLADFADFIELVLRRFGNKIRNLELWNEPDNFVFWNRGRDLDFSKFKRMVALAARRIREISRQQGLQRLLVLGGPANFHRDFWPNLARGQDALQEIDILALHTFFGLHWNEHAEQKGIDNWPKLIDEVKQNLQRIGRPGNGFWITETGFPSSGIPGGRALQAQQLAKALRAEVPRLYWYSIQDLHPKYKCIEEDTWGFEEAFEYHMGLKDYLGRPKPAYYLLEKMLGQEKAADSQSRPLSSGILTASGNRK